MTAKDFSAKYKFNGTDVAIVQKMYGEEKRTEAEWRKELTGHFHFVETSKEKEEVQPETEEVKENKKKKN